MVPKDPIILLSYINLKLRDFYSSLDAFCDDCDEDKAEITRILEGAGYSYDATLNQFV